jgi:hypothetical protein
MNGFARRLIESQLFTRVRCIGNQFAHEDFFIRVKRMDDDVQQLLNLRLKMMGLGLAHWAISLINTDTNVKRPRALLEVRDCCAGRIEAFRRQLTMEETRAKVRC